MHRKGKPTEQPYFDLFQVFSFDTNENEKFIENYFKKLQIEMKMYCVKQRKVTECVPGSKKLVLTKNGREMMTYKCVECGITKTKFVKSNTKSLN